MKKILILGGGFSGIYAAKSLSKFNNKNMDIELISDNNYFIFQPLLPERGPPEPTRVSTLSRRLARTARGVRKGVFPGPDAVADGDGSGSSAGRHAPDRRPGRPRSGRLRGGPSAYRPRP